MTLNRITLIGRLGSDPQLASTRTGTPVAKFSMATDHVFTNGNGDQKRQTTWFQVVAWAKTGENVAKHLTKGSRAYVEGRMASRDWHDREDKKRTSWEVVADRVIFLDAAPASKPSDQNPDAE